MSDTNSTVPEGFRQIPGYPRYAIDESGTVLSVCPRNGKGGNIPWDKAKRLKPNAHAFGYPTVCLRPRRTPICVHTLVLTTFVGPRPNGMHCRHLDGNPENSHISNLVWGTPSENNQDKLLHGTKQWGEKGNGAKLTENDVLTIRARAASGERHVDIAKDFPVTPINISKIVLRRTWKHI